MQIDDRLATVLAFSGEGARALRTQWLQLVDLLGRAGAREPGDASHAFVRLAELDAAIPAIDRARALRAGGLRLRDPAMVLHLAQGDPAIAAAAVAAADLDGTQWATLVPRLPMAARGYLRHRRDLSGETRTMLDRLGIEDFVLTGPTTRAAKAQQITIKRVPAPAQISPGQTPDRKSGIAAIVERIETFRRARGTRDDRSPPLGDSPNADAVVDVAAFDFTADAAGRITSASPPAAPMVFALRLAPLEHAARQALRSVAVDLEGAPAITGRWCFDAMPHFDDGGRFAGYVGRMRRAPVSADVPPSPITPPGQRIREMLHELRTPVNAIQGFAEVIQQQLFGPLPHDYRAIAAAIAGDAARILAGFDELDRLARLETGGQGIEPGMADLADALAEAAQRLAPVLDARDGGFAVAAHGGPAPVALADETAHRLVWRILASIASASGPGERPSVRLVRGDGVVCVEIALPAAWIDVADPFEALPGVRNAGAAVAGAFGPAMALRLARAEAAAAGGSLARDGAMLVLRLPAPPDRGLTVVDPRHSDGGATSQGAAAR